MLLLDPVGFACWHDTAVLLSPLEQNEQPCLDEQIDVLDDNGGVMTALH